MDNTRYFRERIHSVGFQVAPGEHPIVPILIGDAPRAQRMAARMLELGVYVVAFFYPVVPQGKARIRTQVSASHTREDLDRVIAAFATVREEMGG
jgi:glycine C-acetyltransferase